MTSANISRVLLHLRSHNHSGACVFSLTLSAPTLPALISALKAAAECSIHGEPVIPVHVPASGSEELEQAAPAKPARKKKEATPPQELVEVATSAPIEEAPSSPLSRPITLVSLRSQLLELSDAGHRPAVRNLLKQFGVERLTDLPVADYESFAVQAANLAQPV